MQTIKSMPGPQLTLWIQSLFVFSAVWSIGGNTDSAGRSTFNTYVRRLVSNDVPDELALFATGQHVLINQMMPDTKSVYDFVFDKSKSTWQFWLSTTATKPIDPEAEYSNIVVPTVDTIRCAPGQLSCEVWIQLVGLCCGLMLVLVVQRIWDLLCAPLHKLTLPVELVHLRLQISIRDLSGERGAC